MTIDIRPITTYAEYVACEDVQREVWGEFGVVPQHLLLTVQRSGGLVVGAFDTSLPDAPLVGFVFGFLGRTGDGRPKHASHMAAVRDSYRDANIGYRLKLVQRELVLAQGIDLITWTYDPLISRNAHLNIRKLGGICRTYMRNIYGPEPEDPAGDLPSDRFQVEWWLDTVRVEARISGAGQPPDAAELRAVAPLLNPDPLGPTRPLGAARLLLQIPADIEALKAADMACARAWRYQLRSVAEAAFNDGYRVADYAFDGQVGLYLLER